MAEYIKREALKERFRKRLEWLKKDVHDEYSGALLDGCEYDMELIDEIPAIDVAPVVHGQWVKHYRSGTTVADGYVSTCCDMWNARKSNYCPNCGAKMDGGDSDATD